MKTCQKYHILLNKFDFLSLISRIDMLTFVMYLVRNLFFDKLLPMNANHTSRFFRKGLAFGLAGVLMCIFVLKSEAQGWEIYFGGNKSDFGEAILQTRDHGFLVAGYSESFGNDNDMDVYVIRTDVDGDEVWSKIYDEGFIERVYDLIPAHDGGYILVGDIRPDQVSDFDVYLLKINDRGDLIWSRNYGGPARDQGFSVAQTTDGGYIIAGRTSSFGNGEDDVYLIKTDVNGNEIWSRTYGDTADDGAFDVIPFNGGYAVVGASDILSPFPPLLPDLYLILTDENGEKINTFLFGGDESDVGRAITETADGGLIITGSTGNNSDVYLLKTDAAGNLQWSKKFGGPLIDIGNDIIQLNDGTYVLTGVTELTVADPDLYLLKVDNDGNEIWSTAIGRNTHWDEGRSIVATKDGGFAIAGINSFTGGAQINGVSIFKTNASGEVYTNYIQGKVAFDLDADCVVDAGETPLQDWLVVAHGAKSFFGTTDINGEYSIRVDTGTYDLILLPKNPYWNICEDTISNLVFDTSYDTTFIDFAVKDSIQCPFLEVDISTPFLLPCSTDDYTVTYCNQGTTDADSAYVYVVLDEDLIFNSSTLPPVQVINDSLYVFDLDTLKVGECGAFYINVTLDCNATVGAAEYATAHIFPDSICTMPGANWDMSSIEVDGLCEGDSVRFRVQNVGPGNMNNAQELVIIEDIVIEKQASFQLQSGEKQEYTFPASGATYRIVAEQSPGHPGASFPTVAVEACDNGTGSVSLGQVTQFQEDENDPFKSIEVQESISSTDAVLELRGYPKGYNLNDSAFIAANTDIEYHLLFRNTGTDTITRIVIRDTLSSPLDLATVRPGASSHPYDFKIYDNGILKFTFENIELPPDSGAGDSFGFVKFKVSQKPDNPIGTRIDNSAAIFLGFDAPHQTVTKTHFVGGQKLNQFILITGLKTPEIPNIQLKAYPNPFFETTKIEITGHPFNRATLYLFDTMGKQVRAESFAGNTLQLDRNDLPEGIYFYTLEADGQRLASGKIIALGH